jgi:hypothetical protein
MSALLLLAPEHSVRGPQDAYGKRPMPKGPAPRQEGCMGMGDAEMLNGEHEADRHAGL